MKYIDVGPIKNASQIALGCMRIAGKSDSEVDEIIFTALENGINFFDHADIYGGGGSERVFGAFLKRHPEVKDKIIIQTILVLLNQEIQMVLMFVLKEIPLLAMIAMVVKL